MAAVFFIKAIIVSGCHVNNISAWQGAEICLYALNNRQRGRGVGVLKEKQHFLFLFQQTPEI